MNLPKLEELMVSLADIKTQLQNEATGSISHTELSLQIQQLQAQLLDEFGPYLEEALFTVHDEFCPDDEVKPLLDYVPTYFEKEGSNGHTRYFLPKGEGVEVETDDYPGIPTRLALVPNPTRVVLKVQDSGMEEVLWAARELAEA